MKKVAVFLDTSKPTLGLHGLHTAFTGLPGVEVCAFSDSNPDVDEAEVKRRLNTNKRYFDPAEMLEKEKPDIAVITSREPFSHLPQLRLAASFGCNVFTEKPLSADLEETDEAVRIVEESGITVCVAHPGRYCPQFQAVKNALDSGKIGKPLTVSTYGKCDHRGGGEDLMTLGTHLLDLMTYLFGDPESVRAELRSGGHVTGKDEFRKTLEDVGPCAGEEIFADFRFPDNVRGTFESRMNLCDYRTTTTHMGLSIRGTEGIVTARFTDIIPDFPVIFSRTRHPAEFGAPFEEYPATETRIIPGEDPTYPDHIQTVPGVCHTDFMIRGLHYAAWDLLCALDEHRQPVSNVYNARQALEMIYGIYASHRKDGARVAFPLNSRKHPLTGE